MKIPPAFVWVRDFFPLNLFLVELETKRLQLLKLLFELISPCLMDELTGNCFAAVNSCVRPGESSGHALA